MSQLIIDPEFRNLMPALAPDELATLEALIKRDGCLDPLKVWQGIIVDGHNRYAICRKLGKPYDTVDVEFEDRAEVRIWIAQSQLGRRNLNDYQRTRVALSLKEDIAARARERQRGGQGGVLLLENSPKANTREDIAEIAGVSSNTVAKVEWLENNAPAELKQKLEQDEISIDAAYKGEKKKQDLENVRQENVRQAQAQPAENKPIVTRAAWQDWIYSQPDCDLLLTDPPYMTDVEDIEAFAIDWLVPALGKVKSTGRAYVFIGAYPQELAAYLNVGNDPNLHDLILADVLVWTYRNTLGPSPKYDYKLNWQAALYFRGPDAPPLDCPIMNEQFSVQDINAPDGRLANRYHAWQKPDELAERLVRHSTKPGDLVLDPFAGTGTFILAAQRLGRIGRGCDQSVEMLAIAESRGCRIER